MDFAAARFRMVENQLRTNRVTDPRVIEVFARLPREVFVPPHLRGVAYVDEDLALGDGRYVMEPLVLAQLVQTAEIRPDERVLDVGCSTGYGAAVLAGLAASVIALESDTVLAEEARRTLGQLGIAKVEVVVGPLHEGWPRGAPYDVVVFGGAVEEVPAAILDQLAEGGRLVAVVVRSDGVDKGTVFSRYHGVISSREAFEAATPVLPGFERQVGFVF